MSPRPTSIGPGHVLGGAAGVRVAPLPVVMLENIVESVDSELWPMFLPGMEVLGYEIQVVLRIADFAQPTHSITEFERWRDHDSYCRASSLEQNPCSQGLTHGHRYTNRNVQCASEYPCTVSATEPT